MNSFAKLTPTEASIASDLAAGLSRAEIATRHAIGLTTVDTHRAHALRKLGCKNAVQLARLAIREGFTSMHDEDCP